MPPIRSMVSEEEAIINELLLAHQEAHEMTPEEMQCVYDYVRNYHLPRKRLDGEKLLVVIQDYRNMKKNESSVPRDRLDAAQKIIDILHYFSFKS